MAQAGWNPDQAPEWVEAGSGGWPGVDAVGGEPESDAGAGFFEIFVQMTLGVTVVAAASNRRDQQQENEETFHFR